MQRLVALSGWLTGRLENGSLQRYLAWMMLAALVLVAVALEPLPSLGGTLPRMPLDGITALGLLLLALAALATVLFHRQRLVALLAVGVVGLMVSLLFTRYWRRTSR